MKHVLITAVLSMSFLQGMHASAVQADKPPVNPEAKVLADFKTRIDGVRRPAEEGGQRGADAEGDRRSGEDPDGAGSARQAHHDDPRPRQAWRHFHPEITLRFRRLLRPELKDPDTKQLIQEDNPGNVKFKVNGPYPDAEPLSTVPPNVLASLPQLPPDLEYRFVGKHLILRDSRANLVVDYIANAIA